MDKFIEQTRKGRVNEDHFANNEWGSLLQISNRSVSKNVKSTSNMALLLTELVESFSILDHGAHRLQVSVDSRTMFSLIASPSILKE